MFGQLFLYLETKKKLMKKLLFIFLGLASFNVYANGCPGQFDPVSGICRFQGQVLTLRKEITTKQRNKTDEKTAFYLFGTGEF